MWGHERAAPLLITRCMKHPRSIAPPTTRFFMSVEAERSRKDPASRSLLARTLGARRKLEEVDVVKRAPALALSGGCVVAGCRGRAEHRSAAPPDSATWTGSPSIRPPGREPPLRGRIAPCARSSRAPSLRASSREDDAFNRGKSGDALRGDRACPVDEQAARPRTGALQHLLHALPRQDRQRAAAWPFKRGYPIPPSTCTSDRVRGLPDGQIFDVITNGVRNMPSYRAADPDRGSLGHRHLGPGARPEPARGDRRRTSRPR